MVHTLKALALDLDGTLIGTDECISRGTLKAVSELAKSIPIFICTGREKREVQRFGQQLNLTRPQICDNGALVVDPCSNWKPIWHRTLVHSDSVGLINLITEKKFSFIATSLNGSINDISDDIEGEFGRISILDIPEREAEEIIREYSRVPGVNAVKAWLPYNRLWAVDFTAEGVDKGSGVKVVGDLLNLDVRYMACVGDSHNDLAMFDACGLSIAMGNSPESVKSKADFVVGTVETDGLVDAIEEIIVPLLQDGLGKANFPSGHRLV